MNVSLNDLLSEDAKVKSRVDLEKILSIEVVRRKAKLGI